MTATKVVAILFYGLLLAAWSGDSYATDDPLLALAIDLAETPEHHLVIAGHFRSLASEARSQEAAHKAMRTTYRHRHARFKAGRGGDQAMVRHCDRLIELYGAAASEYDALASIHEAEAE